ncbi:MAG TPA: ATP-binding cassette domain-containing protein [Gemmatimonadales bacterium]|nr:ATP-binding cassette domain-containing protein [Gemmatimonadales bacterium]
MTDAAVLQANSIGKRFGRRRVLSAATLIAHPGSITVLLGRNGAGKSTLLKIAAGWWRADYGVVIYKSARYRHPRLADLARRGLFFLPDGGLLDPLRSLRRQMAALVARFPAARARVAHVLELLDLESLADHPVGSLSGGEWRRAEVALAVARQPECLLADEPYRGIAPADAETLSAAFRTLAGEGSAVVITGHDVPILLGVADQVIWQTAGTTRYLGSPDTVETHDQFRREYLGRWP